MRPWRDMLLIFTRSLNRGFFADEFDLFESDMQPSQD